MVGGSRKNRSPDTDPQIEGSYYKDTDEKDPPIGGNRQPNGASDLTTGLTNEPYCGTMLPKKLLSHSLKYCC